MGEIKFLKDSLKMMDKLEMDMKKLSSLKANTATVDKLQDKLLYQTPTLKQHEEVKKFAEGQIEDMKSSNKSFQKKTDRFRIDQGRLNEKHETKFKDFDDVIEQTEDKVTGFAKDLEKKTEEIKEIFETFEVCDQKYVFFEDYTILNDKFKIFSDIETIGKLQTVFLPKIYDFAAKIDAIVQSNIEMT